LKLLSARNARPRGQSLKVRLRHIHRESCGETQSDKDKLNYSIFNVAKSSFFTWNNFDLAFPAFLRILSFVSAYWLNQIPF